MIILSQDGERLVDAKYICYDSVEEKYHYILSDDKCSIGLYPTKARCLAVIEEIYNNNYPGYYSDGDSTRPYKMPKE